ncbi:glycosyltransferase involved in cell wall biosynthesis [Marmoricola sp. URHA0025 HA25]
MTAPLRVTMPLLTLVPGHMGGSETYVRGLVDALGRQSDVELTVIVPPVSAGNFVGAREVVAHRIKSEPSVRGRLTTIAKGWTASGDLREAMRSADVVHHPLIVPVPRVHNTPWVVTLLDVQHRDLPGMFTRSERVYRRLAYDATARRADRVITISDFCRERIVDQLAVGPDRIDVAHLGVAPEWFKRGEGTRLDFVFYPAAAWPHKNHQRLLAAMEIVRERHPAMRLVLTGQNTDRLGALPSWSEHLGQVDSSVLRELYSSAACLAFPSLYEGFGFPPLEAMAAGCPVAAADAGSVPEICGDAAVLFDPLDPMSIAQGILSAIDDGTELAARGRAHVSRFTWEACAEAHVASYRAAAAQA